MDLIRRHARALVVLAAGLLTGVLTYQPPS